MSHLRRNSVIILALLAIVVYLAMYRYRVHLLWCYQARAEGFDVRAVPSHEMPDEPVPADWVRLQVGVLDLSLPPELAENPESFDGMQGTARTFSAGGRLVSIGPLSDDSDMQPMMEPARRAWNGARPLTLTTFRLACYQVDSRDFSWRMSPQEAGLHAYLITLSRQLSSSRYERLETLFSDDVEGLLFFDDRGAVFCWHDPVSQLGSSIYFRTYDAVPFDPHWVRAVCRSISLRDDPAGDGDAAPPSGY